MTCSEMQEQIGLLADGGVDPDEARPARRHLEACPSCRREMRVAEQSIALTGALSEMSPPADLRLRVQAAARHDAEDRLARALHALPEVEPPADLRLRVAAAVGADRPAASRWARPLRWMVAVPAAAAVLAIALWLKPTPPVAPATAALPPVTEVAVAPAIVPVKAVSLPAVAAPRRTSPRVRRTSAEARPVSVARTVKPVVVVAAPAETAVVEVASVAPPTEEQSLTHLLDTQQPELAPVQRVGSAPRGRFAEKEVMVSLVHVSLR